MRNRRSDYSRSIERPSVSRRRRWWPTILRYACTGLIVLCPSFSAVNGSSALSGLVPSVHRTIESKQKERKRAVAKYRHRYRTYRKHFSRCRKDALMVARLTAFMRAYLASSCAPRSSLCNSRNGAMRLSRARYQQGSRISISSVSDTRRL